MITLLLKMCDPPLSIELLPPCSNLQGHSTEGVHTNNCWTLEELKQ